MPGTELVIPAQVAGVERICLATPPPDADRGAATRHGVTDQVLAAAYLLDIDEVYCLGGSHAVAALACQRYFNFETVLPIHYGTFPIIDQTPESFVTGMASGPTEVLTPKPGETVEL